MSQLQSPPSPTFSIPLEPGSYRWLVQTKNNLYTLTITVANGNVAMTVTGGYFGEETYAATLVYPITVGGRMVLDVPELDPTSVITSRVLSVSMEKL